MLHRNGAKPLDPERACGLFFADQVSCLQRIADGQIAEVTDEISVADAVEQDFAHIFSAKQMRIIRFCADECRVQKSRAPSVGRMLAGYNWISSLKPGSPVSLVQIQELLVFIEPYENQSGFRRKIVEFREPSFCVVDFETIPNWLTETVLPFQPGTENAIQLPPAELFARFEEIHPAGDGNGRAGAILFNHWNGTLDEPVRAPYVDFAERRQQGICVTLPKPTASDQERLAREAEYAQMFSNQLNEEK